MFWDARNLRESLKLSDRRIYQEKYVVMTYFYVLLTTFQHMGNDQGFDSSGWVMLLKINSLHDSGVPVGVIVFIVF